MDKLTKEIWPYLIAAIVALVILTFLPQLSLWIPVSAGLYFP